MPEYRILPAGDMALVVEFGNEISPACNALVKKLNQSLRKTDIPGMIETVPTYRSLLIHYDPLRLSYKKLCRYIKASANAAGEAGIYDKKRIEIPVCYGGQYGEDLTDVAQYVGMSEAEVIRLHSGRDYLIYMMGFLPGFPYLGGMDNRLKTPRLSNPRTVIPAGSVGIGGEQTGVYPIASPGGWRLIGRTPLKLYDSGNEKPTLYQTGDYIRFQPIDETEYAHIEELIKLGQYVGKVEIIN